MPRESKYADMKEEAIKLRKEHRLGTKEISRRTGVPISTLHYWLKDMPLSDGERRKIISSSPRYRTPKKDLPGRGGRRVPTEYKLQPQDLCCLGEAMAMGRLAERGIKVFRPVADCDIVDLYARKNRGQKIAFIQARVAANPPSRNGLPTISLRRYRNGKSNRFQEGDFHFLVGYCRQDDSCYVYTYDEVAHLANSVTVSEDALEAWWKIEKFLGIKTAKGKEAA